MDSGNGRRVSCPPARRPFYHFLPDDHATVLDASSPAAKSVVNNVAKEKTKVSREKKEQDGGQGEAEHGEELDCKKFEVDHAGDDSVQKILPLSRREAEALWFLQNTEGEADSLNHIAVRGLNQPLSWSSSTEDLTPTLVSTAVLWVRGRATELRVRQGQSF